jgi:exopolyphosphatase/pppGpp-phosphohydrolase
MKKAILDIGSLKVKVAIFDVPAKKLLENASYMTLLGKGISEQHHIAEESLAQLDTALASIAQDFADKKIQDIVIIGTEALRRADNAHNVHMLIEQHLPGHTLKVIDQHEEADLFFTAVSREFPDQDLVAMDIGGGSVQLVYGKYNSAHHQTVITKKYNFTTGTYTLQQRYSPDNEHITQKFPEARKVVVEAFKEITHTAPVLIFGSTCMLDFIISTHITPGALQQLLVTLGELSPNKRNHLFPQGGYFMYGADYLLLNLLEAIARAQPEKIYPTNLNSSYGFI